jgi:hypothetical protein
MQQRGAAWQASPQEQPQQQEQHPQQQQFVGPSSSGSQPLGGSPHTGGAAASSSSGMQPVPYSPGGSAEPGSSGAGGQLLLTHVSATPSTWRPSPGGPGGGWPGSGGGAGRLASTGENRGRSIGGCLLWKLGCIVRQALFRTCCL